MPQIGAIRAALRKKLTPKKDPAALDVPRSKQREARQGNSIS